MLALLSTSPGQFVSNSQSPLTRRVRETSGTCSQNKLLDACSSSQHLDVASGDIPSQPHPSGSPDPQNCDPDICRFNISKFWGNFLRSKKLSRTFHHTLGWWCTWKQSCQVKLPLQSFIARLVQEQVSNVCTVLSQCLIHSSHTVKYKPSLWLSLWLLLFKWKASNKVLLEHQAAPNNALY